MKKQRYYCSFCGTSNKEHILVTNRKSAFICFDCTLVCVEIQKKEHKKRYNFETIKDLEV